MITIENLTKKFGSVTVWEDVNLNIEEGETLALIGKSGSGKSVLMKHINALMVPTEGRVLIEDQNIFDMPYARLRRIRQKFGILFQGGALFDSISAFENVAFPLKYFTDYEEAVIRDRAMYCLEQVNLADIGNKSSAELSGGMKKRVAMARAIVLEPDYLLYDEPTSGLDPVTSEEINELIIRMADQLDVTSVVVSHDIHSVLQVADKAAFIDQQKLSWYGSVEDMKKAEHKDLLDFITASEYQITQTGVSH